MPISPMPEPAAHGAEARSQSIPLWQRIFPGLVLLREYRREWFPGDLLAGISVCVIMIPSVIAYAVLMGLPPQHGLYAALVPLLVYPLFGTSRHVIVGPDIAISLLIASAIGPMAAGDPARAATLASVVALLTGLLLILAARARLGAVADFLSKPVLVGYMTGAALILMASQVNKLFGITLKNSDFFPRLAELFTKINGTHLPTLAVGLVCVATLFLLGRFAPKIPGALVTCLGAGIAVQVLGLESRGVAVVGSFPSGLPHPVLPIVELHEIHSLATDAIGIALLTYAEGILLARAFAAQRNYEVNANTELTALGLADIAAALFQGFSITGSQSRTTVNVATGAKSQLSSIIAAVSLGVFLLLLTSLIAKLPQVALASVLIYAGVGLVEFDVMARIYRFYPRSAVVAALTTLSVLVAGVVPGIIFGVALSLLGLISRIAHPHDAVLREVPGHGFHDMGEDYGIDTVPGLVAYRFYAPLLFPNASHFLERVRKAVSTCPTGVRWFLIDAQAITDIDVTAVEVLRTLNTELNGRGICLKIAHANPPLRELLLRTGLASEIGADSFFGSVHECVEAFQKTALEEREKNKGTSAG